MKSLFFLFLFLPLLSPAQNWVMVWQDEFSTDGTPDPSKWDYDTGGHGWGNQELQYYTDRPENARVENGNLIIEARKESFQGNEYTSARLVTKGKASWLYGKIEVRADLPQGTGIWPAIWMLPEENTYGGWPSSGEIDIMEYVGYDPGRIHFNIHTEAYNHSIGTNKGASVLLNNPETNFYTYSVEWYPDSLVFKVDGTKTFRFDRESDDYSVWPFDIPFHLLLNIAVGGTWGGQQGIDDQIFPQQFLIDYVRVYAWQQEPGPFDLTTSVFPAGTGTVNPQNGTFEGAEQVTVTAQPGPGYRFVRWTGDISSPQNPLTFTMVKSMALQAEFMDEDELVINGNFDSGVNNWSLSPGGNTYSTDGGKFCYTITNGGINPWDVAISQSGISVETGMTYKLRFKASAGQTRTIRAGVGMSHDPWTTYHYETVSIGTTEQVYELVFQSNSTDDNARVMFDVGGTTGSLCLDEVSLQEAVATGSADREENSGIIRLRQDDGYLIKSRSGKIKELRVYYLDGREKEVLDGDVEKTVIRISPAHPLIIKVKMENGAVFTERLF